MRRALGPATALLAALALGGCGTDTDTKNHYVDSVNRTQTQLAERFNRLQTQITGTTTPEQDRATLGGFADAVDDAVKDLRSVDAPDEVSRLHREFIEEVSEYGVEVRKAREALASGNSEKVLDAQQQLISSVGQISTRINRTIAAINDELKG